MMVYHEVLIKYRCAHFFAVNRGIVFVVEKLLITSFVSCIIYSTSLFLFVELHDRSLTGINRY